MEPVVGGIMKLLTTAKAVQSGLAGGGDLGALIKLVAPLESREAQLLIGPAVNYAAIIRVDLAGLLSGRAPSSHAVGGAAEAANHLVLAITERVGAKVAPHRV